MSNFHVTANACDFGIIQAEDAQTARDLAAQDAGYESEAAMVEALGQPSEMQAKEIPVIEIEVMNPWTQQVFDRDITAVTKDELDAYLVLIEQEEIDEINDQFSTEPTPGEWLAAWAKKVGPERAGAVILGS